MRAARPEEEWRRRIPPATMRAARPEDEWRRRIPPATMRAARPEEEWRRQRLQVVLGLNSVLETTAAPLTSVIQQLSWLPRLLAVT